MSNIVTFGETTFRNQARRFGIKADDRRRHMYLIGKTGMGKSTILENMIVGDIRAGRGVAVVDPHGDLAEKVIQYIPAERIQDVVYFNPSDMDYPIAFNVVEQVEPHLRHLVASGLLGVFKKLWADSWGPRLEYILRNTVLAVLDYPGATLLAVTRMLADKKFREDVVSKVKDPVVKAFWTQEFTKYADKFATEAVAPIQNKVGQFLSTSLVRNVIGQSHSSIDIRDIMDKRKILIMNLSKGRIGEDNSSLLGAIMITKIQLAAMSRVDIDENERQDFYLYVDEFQNFATESFANILSEARKYRLNLIMAHQYIEQLDEKVQNAVFGNVGTLIVFRVGAADAEALVPEFTPTFTEDDIVNIPKYEFYLKLMIDGISSDPFSARGLPPLTGEEKTGNMEKMIDSSRRLYARSRAEVEAKIMEWHEQEPGNIDTTAQSASSAYSKDSSPRKKGDIEITCDLCGKKDYVNFVPNKSKPIYCEDCMKKMRREKQLRQELGELAPEVGRRAHRDFNRPRDDRRAGAPYRAAREERVIPARAPNLEAQGTISPLQMMPKSAPKAAPESALKTEMKKEEKKEEKAKPAEVSKKMEVKTEEVRPMDGKKEDEVTLNNLGSMKPSRFY